MLAPVLMLVLVLVLILVLVLVTGASGTGTGGYSGAGGGWEYQLSTAAGQQSCRPVLRDSHHQNRPRCTAGGALELQLPVWRPGL